MIFLPFLFNKNERYFPNADSDLLDSSSSYFKITLMQSSCESIFIITHTLSATDMQIIFIRMRI